MENVADVIGVYQSMVEGYKKTNLMLEGTIESLKVEINTMSAVRNNMRRTIEELRKQSGLAFEALEKMLRL